MFTAFSSLYHFHIPDFPMVDREVEGAETKSGELVAALKTYSLNLFPLFYSYLLVDLERNKEKI